MITRQTMTPLSASQAAAWTPPTAGAVDALEVVDEFDRGVEDLVGHLDPAVRAARPCPAALVRYLLRSRGMWRTTAEISQAVFRRSDPAGHNLVWKYVSTLRTKLGKYELLRRSQKFGYRLVEDDSSPALPRFHGPAIDSRSAR